MFESSATHTIKPIFHCDTKLLAFGTMQMGEPPNAKICVGNTNMLISKNAKICTTPNAEHKICFTPNTKPQHEPMEYRLRWVPNAKFSRWPCTFHIVCAHFICVGYPT